MASQESVDDAHPVHHRQSASKSSQPSLLHQSNGDQITGQDTDAPLPPNVLFTTDGPLSTDYLNNLAALTNSLKSGALGNPDIPYYGRLRFYSMHHITQELNALHNKTLGSITASREDLERLRFLLHEQVSAMKDQEYINSRLEDVSEDYFFRTLDTLRSKNLAIDASSCGWLYTLPQNRTATSRLEGLLKAFLPRQLAWSTEEKKRQPHYYATGQRPSETSTAVRVIAGIIISVVSGASIIVPMVIMSFSAGKNKSLITTSIAVLLFGFVLAAVIRVKSENVFLATATYAAVLTVFVGTSGTTGV